MGLNLLTDGATELYLSMYLYSQYSYSSWEASGDDDESFMIFMTQKKLNAPKEIFASKMLRLFVYALKAQNSVKHQAKHASSIFTTKND